MENLRTSALATRKKTILVHFFIIFLILNAYSYSQPSITFNKMYDGPFHSSELSHDICDIGNGNFLVTGYTENKLYILKINSYGDTIWTKLFNNYGIPGACEITFDNNCIIAGWGYILKIDYNGNVLWQIDSTGRCNDVIRTNDNNFIACGTQNAFYGYVIKFKLDGTVMWQKFYLSSYSREYNSIAKLNNSYVLAGTTNESVSGLTKGLLTKINDTGGVEWEKQHIIIDNRYAAINNIVNVYDGFIIGGTTGDSNGATFGNIFFARTDIMGNIIYNKIFTSNQTEYLRCLKGGNNRYIVSAYRFQFDSVFAKFLVLDSIGNVKAQKSISSPDDIEFNSLLPLTNGDIIFAGNSDFLSSGGRYDIHLIRTDSLLNFPLNIFGIEPINGVLPKKFTLHQNFPNPFNPATKIRFELPISCVVQLIVYDLHGKTVVKLINQYLKIGIYEISYTPNIASGIYFYSLVYNNNIETRKMILIK
jgi:hypothetical protein